MGVEKVVFYSISDREPDVIKKYTMEGKHLGFIIHREHSWGDFYSYMMSVAEVEDVKEIPE